ncbi:DDE Tnp4 domain-containing protein [Abeliophyllum distichum]|uniref:DDE Tnp4 domain-containing protein n=1 Tax=Abeliophyllum distichum TaxID=126358 RepID=A0ABD1PSI2_9LAMI
MNDQFVYESVRNANSNDDMDRLEKHIPLWLEYCRTAESIVRDYLQRCRVRIRRFSNARNGHLFMLEALQEDPQIAFQEFRMYPSLFVNFTHVLRDEFELSSGRNVDNYEQVGLDTWPRIKERTSDIIFKSSVWNLIRVEEGSGDACEHFNFKHSSLRNVIERAFGILKNRWTILDRMPRYPFQKQTAVVVTAMTVYNFIRRAGQRDYASRTETEVDEAAEIDLPDEIEQIAADYNAPQISNTE